MKHFAGFTCGHMITENLKVWKNLIFIVNQDMTVAVEIATEAIANQASASAPPPPCFPAQNQKKLGVSGGCEPMASLLAPHFFTN